MEEIKISENQRKVLENLAEIYNHDANCRFFSGIARETGIEERLVRLACRALARKGLTEFVRGLFNDDGMVAGSGYCATRAGALLVSGCRDCKKSVADMDDGRCSECWNDRKCDNCGKRYREHKLEGGHMKGFSFKEEALKKNNT